MTPHQLLGAPQPLTAAHDVGEFDCGNAALNTFLRRYALGSQRALSARTYVACRGASRVVGYYSLAAASADFDKVPQRVAKGLARHPIPLTLLARLGVDRSEQGKGLGAALLKDAFLRFLQAQEIVASRAFLVQAKDDTAKQFYGKFGFEASPVDVYHLYILTKDIKRTLG